MFKKISLFILALVTIQNHIDAAADFNVGKKIVALASAGHFSAVHTLIEKYGIDIVDKERNTPLHLAVQKGLYRLVNFLIKNGADVNAQNNNLDTPLHIAAVRGNLKIVHCLCNAGANRSLTNAHGKTAHDIAKSYGNYRSASICAVSPDNPDTYPTSTATWEQQNLILQQEAFDRANHARLAQQLHQAIFVGDDMRVGILLANGAPIDYLDPYRNNILQTYLSSSSNPSIDLLNILLSFRPPLDAQNVRGDTSLHFAARNNQQAHYELILAAGANPEIQNSDGISASDIIEMQADKTLISQDTSTKNDGYESRDTLSEPEMHPKPEQPTASPKSTTYAQAAQRGMVHPDSCSDSSSYPIDRSSPQKHSAPSSASPSKPTPEQATSSSSSSSSSSSQSWWEIVQEEEEKEAQRASSSTPHVIPKPAAASYSAHRTTDGRLQISKKSKYNPDALCRTIEYIKSASFAEDARVIFLTYLFETQEKPCSLNAFFERIAKEYGREFSSETIRSRTQTIIHTRQSIIEKVKSTARWEKETDLLVLIVIRNAIVEIIKNPSDFPNILNETHHLCKYFHICHRFVHAVLKNYSDAEGITSKKKSFKSKLTYKPKKTSLKATMSEKYNTESQDDTLTDPDEFPLSNSTKKSPALINTQAHTWNVTALLIVGAQDASELPTSLDTVNKKYDLQLTTDSAAYRQALGFFEKQHEAAAAYDRHFKPSNTTQTMSEKKYMRMRTIIEMGLYAQIIQDKSLSCRQVCRIVKKSCGAHLIPISFAVVKEYKKERDQR